MNNPFIPYQKQFEQIMKDANVSKASLFGSYARGEAKENSDVDLLVRFRDKKSLFDIVAVELQLSDLLNKKVDLVPEQQLNQRIKPYIQDDLKVIYG